MNKLILVWAIEFLIIIGDWIISFRAIEPMTFFVLFLFTIRPVVRNGWTAKQADNGLLSRWSERPENDRLLLDQSPSSSRALPLSRFVLLSASHAFNASIKMALIVVSFSSAACLS